MVDTLPISVPWLPGETALSLGVRLGRANFASTMTQFGNDTGFDAKRLVVGRVDAIDHVAALAGVDAARLRSTTLIRSGSTNYTINGQVLERSSVRLRSLRSCPRCLVSGEPYARVWWDVEPRRICLTHSTPHRALITGAYDHSHDFAAYVENNRDALRRLADEAEHSAVHDGELYLQGRLHGRAEADVWLNRLPFTAAARAMDVFGAVAQFGTKVNFKKISDADLRRAAPLGFEVLKGGRKTAWPLLHQLSHASGLNAISGPQDIFGGIFKWLANPGLSDVSPLQDMLRAYCIENLALEPGSIFLGKRMPERRRHSLVSLGNQFGRRSDLVTNLMLAAGIVRADDLRPKSLITFPAERAERLMKRFCEGISHSKVDVYLNIPKRHRIALVASGHLKPIIQAPGAATMFHHDDLDQFLINLTKRAADVEGGRSKNQISIAEIVRRDHRCMPERVVELILGGHLKRVGKISGVHGYASIVVDYDEVCEVLRGNSPHLVAKSTWIKEFGANSKGLDAAIAAMQMTVVTKINPLSHQPGQYLSADEISRVSKEFVSLRDLSKLRGETEKKTRRILGERGIHPIPSKNKSLFIYRRSDLI